MNWLSEKRGMRVDSVWSQTSPRHLVVEAALGERSLKEIMEWTYLVTYSPLVSH